MTNLQEKYSNLICDFLKSHSFISVHALEKECNIPQGTINQATNQSRQIPAKHIYNILCELVDYGLKINDYTMKFDPEDGNLYGRKWVENVGTEEEGQGFVYIVKEHRVVFTNFADLI